MCRRDDYPPYDNIEEDAIVFDAKSVGRYATRVRVRTPQGSVYDGNTGVVARQVGTTCMVRLDQRFGGLTLPFARSELEALS